MTNIYDKIAELNRNNIKAVLCTVVNTVGSTPGKIGFKMLVLEQGEFYGTVGGGLVEKTVIDRAMFLFNKSHPVLVRWNLSSDLGMKCGGSMEIYMEPVFNNFKLLQV